MLWTYGDLWVYLDMVGYLDKKILLFVVRLIGSVLFAGDIPMKESNSVLRQPSTTDKWMEEGNQT